MFRAFVFFTQQISKIIADGEGKNIFDLRME